MRLNETLLRDGFADLIRRRGFRGRTNKNGSGGSRSNSSPNMSTDQLAQPAAEQRSHEEEDSELGRVWALVSDLFLNTSS